MKKLVFPLSILALLVGRLTVATADQTVSAPRDHWAFQPISAPVVSGAAHPIDELIDRLLRERGLEPTAPADIRTLIRRAVYDLHGLPPTEAQLATKRAELDQLIARLLESPRYGERWGRHWLDVARYSDAKDGVLMYGDQRIRPFAYTYRDWVIDAFNEDKPFDEFIRLQISADQMDLPADSPDLAAMGLLTLGRMFDNNLHDVIDDQIDVVTRGFLGLTASCSRCHDHKFDPIPTTDYYSLYGIFASSVEPYERPRIAMVPKGGEAFEKEFAAKLQEVRTRRREHYERTLRVARERTADYLAAVATTEADVSETAIFFLSLIPNQLRPQITNRWRQLIARRATPSDPVFAPWHDLMRDPEIRVERWKEIGVDARVIDGIVAAQPKTPEAIARTYGRILRDVWGAESDLRAELASLRAEIRRIETTSFDLADIVAGGDGTGTGVERGGIHPVTGRATKGGVGLIKIEKHDVAVRVPDNAFVDSVFVPMSGASEMTTTGLRAEDLPKSSGQTWDYFKRGPSEGFTTNSIDGVDYSKPPHSLLGLHANKGITFDLRALRDRHGFAGAHLRALFGHGGAKGMSALHGLVFLDGRRVAELLDFPAQGKGRALDIELPPESRFLTLIALEGPQGISHDQAILGDARIEADAERKISPEKERQLVGLRQRETEIESRLANLDPARAGRGDTLADLLLSKESPVWFPEDQIYYYLSRQDKDAFRGLTNQLDAISVRHRSAASRAMILVDADTIYDPVVFERGDPTQRGASVPRRFLGFLSRDERRTFTKGSGRLELAHAISSPQNPLTARVWVNRIWMHHFGNPLVENPSDFGLRTPEPLHRELLDLLATRLIEEGWRTKPIHRLIMTSRAYQRASSIHGSARFAKQVEEDPENDYLWRANRRRLDLEQYRDTLLSVSGQLSLEMHGRPKLLDDANNRRRTIYAFVERQNLPNLVKIFDFPTADSSAARRVRTTVPQQALFAMTSPLMERTSRLLAERAREGSVRERVMKLYRLALGRDPDAEEIALAENFVSGSPWEHFAQILLMSNERIF